MENTTAGNFNFTEKFLSEGYTYFAYNQLIINLFAENKTTGPNQSESYLNYTKMNLRRIARIEKTVKISEELSAAAKAINTPQTWVILTEAWCGDAAYSLPVLAKTAELNPKIELRLYLRDKNLDLMDAYLTDGRARSIPKVVFLETHNLKELAVWGALPAALKKFKQKLTEKGTEKAQITTQAMKWYALDKTVEIQTEFTELLRGIAD